MCPYIMHWPNQSPDLNPIEQTFAEEQTEGKMAQEQAGTEERCSSITRDEIQCLVMSLPSTLQAVIDCKGFATKY